MLSGQQLILLMDYELERLQPVNASAGNLGRTNYKERVENLGKSCLLCETPSHSNTQKVFSTDTMRLKFLTSAALGKLILVTDTGTGNVEHLIKPFTGI
jgi:hypothetical protein